MTNYPEEILSEYEDRGLRRAILLLGMVWLTVHFFTGGRV